MRLYLYLNKEYLKLIAPKILNLSLDINYYEYSERRSCTSNDNIGVRPEIRFSEEKKSDGKVEIIKDNSQISNVEITKRYINIEDITQIKNNYLYFNIIENLIEDDNIVLLCGIIESIDEDNTFVINNSLVIYNKECDDIIKELYKYKCQIKCFVFKLNCTQNPLLVSKLLTIFLE